MVSFEDGEGQRLGLLLNDRGELVDVAAIARQLNIAAPRHFGDLLVVLTSGQNSLADVLYSLESDGSTDRIPEAVLPIDAVRLRAPITPGAQILCAGGNYRSHLQEMQAMAVPSSVLWFTKATTAVIGPNDAIILPRHAPDMVDYEGELAVVIGRPCYRVSEDEALSFVGGYTLLNDVSARDWVKEALAAEDPQEVRASWGRNLLGKQFPTFCPLGPVVVTSDELQDPGDLHLTTRVNGAVVQDSSTADLIVGVPALVSYFSQFVALAPGDIISTGSPPGVGVARTPPIFLAPGDRVEIEVAPIGVLSNPVEAE
ncbi:fumarylacetoacetate hydrolase family protein [Aciditerrimonas ferrireducens]|uniref:Fumarylacetoacetate hydrolase family protein n=1 Tax=Aciditerrimonas ferrireducens TaxID=667306 RepID=A0ABV6C8F1_9ACTN